MPSKPQPKRTRFGNRKTPRQVLIAAFCVALGVVGAYLEIRSLLFNPKRPLEIAKSQAHDEPIGFDIQKPSNIFQNGHASLALSEAIENAVEMAKAAGLKPPPKPMETIPTTVNKLEIMYTSLLTELKLNDYEAHAFMDKILERQLEVRAVTQDPSFALSTLQVNLPMRFDPVFNRMAQPTVTVSFSSPTRDAAIEAATVSTDAAIRSLLGDQRYKQYVLYRETYGFRSAVIGPLDTKLPKIEQLDEEQSKKLLELLFTSKQQKGSEPSYNFIPSFVVNGSASFLDASQLAALTEMADELEEKAAVVTAEIARAKDSQ